MKEMLKQKKGVFNQLGSFGVGIATLAIVLVVGFLIIAQAQTQIATIDGITNTSNPLSFSTGYNATITLENAMDDIPSWVPLVVIAAIGGILLSLVSVLRRQG